MVDIKVLVTAQENSMDIVKWLATVHGARYANLVDHTYRDIYLKGLIPSFATFVANHYTLPAVKAAYDFERAMCRLKGVYARIML